MAGDKNIFDALHEYQEHYDRPLPIKYDLLYFSDQHRKFDALLRRYWTFLHPLSRDLFTSFANEFQYIITLLEENQTSLKEKEKEVEELTNSIAEKLKEFELTFENRILDGVANIKNNKFDEIYKQNQDLREEIHQLNKEIQNKEELIRNLRDEISLLIDDSDKQAETTKKLETNIADSIEHFDGLAKQLDSFELELGVAQQERDIADQQIGHLVSELEEKDEEIKNIRESYEIKLRDSEEKFHSLKQKVREISPNIEKIHSQSKIVQQENARLLRELNNVKDENEKMKVIVGRIQELDIEKLKLDKIELEKQVEILHHEIDTLKVKSLHQQSLIEEYKQLNQKPNNMANTPPVIVSDIEKHQNQSVPKIMKPRPPVQSLKHQLRKENISAERPQETEDDLDAIKRASQLPVVPEDKVSTNNLSLSRLEEVIVSDDKSDIKLAIKNSLANMRREHEEKSKKNNKDKSGSLFA